LRKGPWPWSGTGGTLNAAFAVPSKDGSFRTIVAPSWRFIMDFSDIDKSTMVLPAGESGNPKSDHFFDFFPLWESGKRWTVPFRREKVLAKQVQTLVLTPSVIN
jgi:penicillin amidase